jgi:hypothetical protein
MRDVIDRWTRRNRPFDAVVTGGTRVTIRSNLRLRHGTAAPRIRLEGDSKLRGLLTALSGALETPIFDEREGAIDPAILVTVNGKPYGSLRAHLETPLADGDEVGISLVLIAGG